MKLLGPTRHPRLNEGIGIVYLGLGVALTLSLISYHPEDPSWNTATSVIKPLNLIGKFGAHAADALLQLAGMGAFTLPVLLFGLAWKWLRSEPIEAQWIKASGSVVLVLAVCTGFSLGPQWRPFGSAVTAGGLVGTLLADTLLAEFNMTGTVILTLSTIILSIYVISTFSLSLLPKWFARPIAFFHRSFVKWQSWREVRIHRMNEKARLRAEAAREAAARGRAEKRSRREQIAARDPQSEPLDIEVQANDVPIVEDTPPWESSPSAPATRESTQTDIPIHVLEDYEPVALENTPPTPAPAPVQVDTPATQRRMPKKSRSAFRLPPTGLLNEPQARPGYDAQELKDIAIRIKAKFEEFNVLGSVVQINPGPVVTTFEFKPEAGIKYSRITTLTEDLCLGLQAESILIERIPGKPTVGIEVPNSNREVINLRQVLESDEFSSSASPLTMSLGKDISGRIRVAALDSMPHLLIAGSTGSGKSVMLNTMIMSLLYKSTPNDVRMIMVDPKRVELGIYEGIPHLLTPVITDARKATNALRNAVLEMERRLKLLAAQGVRNIDQYNKKLRQFQETPRSLFEEDTEAPEELEPLPYILILIDELADLMMLERANVEESVTRLAQMARAVGMHLVLATQRPSVDVITGLIKANFPARISFRVATRVDSRTILDVMGSEHLLGKGDMLFLPPGSSRLTRVHGAYITENEIERVVDFWKQQAAPEYDQTFLLAPPSDDEDSADADAEFEGAEDPMYQDAVRIVLEMGKASTSTLQRRLRLGYGRAARILDMMQREGIIGPPDGSRPREVLKRPDWLQEVEQQYR
jgi:DNA segregation ATPase FtsK/SpoIIIE, S-DNA-T family